MVSGLSECFGTELAVGQPYQFSDCNKCIFTWHGCVIEIEGDCHAYLSEETPMNIYANTHGIIQNSREIARHANSIGPIVMITGATDSGKSSLCELLCNYATRLGETITFVDIDVAQSLITVPGNIGAISLEKPLDINEGYGMAPPIVYYYGSTSIGTNPKLLKKQIANLAKSVNERLAENSKDVGPSGCIINTGGWVDGEGYELLLTSIEHFSPDVLLVLDNERLYSDLDNDVDKTKKPVSIVKLPKSGGVVQRDTETKKKRRIKSIREYFYGVLGDLSPHTLVISFSKLIIYKLNSAIQAPASALPIGEAINVDPLQLVRVEPSIDMIHSILGVSTCKIPDSEDMIDWNLAGFVYVSDVNMEKRLFTLMTPCPGKYLPSRHLIMTDIKYLE
eukprot:TRINITY_DN9375_c0_g1_i1.p1 TRINITY_DN9375_c0_g1~~TRINITY_DN9375_c0_g1_i1.p1  ORF type:complete len:432 (+),score=68.04 TRINITY_DN9375_c0_g1_i1:120-1298(+)